MNRKQLGGGGPLVSAIGLGAGGGLSGHDAADKIRDRDAVVALRSSFERGISFVDTAEAYDDGRSEEVVGQAIAEHFGPVIVATKVSPENLTPIRLRRALDASLKRLNLERVGLYQIHWSNPAVPLTDTMGTLADLVREGKIGQIGVCNFSRQELDEARKSLGAWPLASLQAEYNLFDRSAECDLIPYCEEHKMAFIAYSPLDQGHICGSPRRRSALEEIARHYGCSLGTLALAWLIRRAPVIVIPKAARQSHIVANAQAGTITLDEADCAAIDQLTRAASVTIPVESIEVAPAEPGDNRKIYRTLAEAEKNIYGLTPSPAQLAEQILRGDFLKPVRVRKAAIPRGKIGYELIEGRVRYWAWVIAFGGRRDIPVLVREM